MIIIESDSPDSHYGFAVVVDVCFVLAVFGDFHFINKQFPVVDDAVDLSGL